MDISFHNRFDFRAIPTKQMVAEKLSKKSTVTVRLDFFTWNPGSVSEAFMNNAVLMVYSVAVTNVPHVRLFAASSKFFFVSRVRTKMPYVELQQRCIRGSKVISVPQRPKLTSYLAPISLPGSATSNMRIRLVQPAFS